VASTLVQSQAHPADLLALYLHTDGVLADATKVEYAVFDASAGYPGNQVLPVAGRTEVTTGAGHVATGVYGVYNPTTLAFWAPAATIKRGRVVWYFRRTATAAEEVLERAFEVFPAATVRTPSSGLALVQDARDAGVPAARTDAQVFAALLRWRDLIERTCRQRFRPVRETRTLRGKGGALLQLGEPLVGLASWSNGGTTCSLSALQVYGHSGADRHNPYLEVAREDASIFTAAASSEFTWGLPQAIAGVWGFVDPDFEPPLEIREAALRGVYLGFTDAPVSASGVRKAETTDKHSVTWALDHAPARPGLLALLRDPAIQAACRLYRAPLALGAPGGDSR